MLVSVTLSAPDDWNDHKEMLDFGFARYERLTLAKKGEFTAPLPLTGGTADYAIAANADEISVMLPRSHGEITYRIEAPQILVAPVKVGDCLGRVVYLCDGEEIASSDLVAVSSVETPQKKFSLLDWFFSLFGG